MAELDDRKLRAEIANLEAQAAKTEAERRRLSGSWRDWLLEAIKVFSALALGAGGIAAAVTGYQLSEVKKERTDLDIAKAQTHLEELNRQKESADAAVGAAQGQLVAIRTELTSLQTNLEEAQRSRPNGAGSLQAAITSAASIQSAVAATTARLQAAERTAAETTNPSNLLVGVQTLGASDAERQALNKRLSDTGYGLHELSESYQARPSWFAPASTVLYYSNSSRSAAQALAAKLGELTGQPFGVQRGSGLGVDPGQQATTLFVHYVKK